MPPQLWVVRAGDEIAGEVEKASLVAIGWEELGDLTGCHSREEVKERYRQAYGELSEAKVAIGAGQVYRFIREIKIGDLVLTPLKVTREVLVGEITGDYAYDPKAISAHYPNVRKVIWKKKISRDDISVPFRNALGGIMTVFNLSSYLDEVRLILSGKTVKPTETADEEPGTLFYDDVREKADEIISDLLSKIDPYDFQNLVAGLLNAMGFKTLVRPRGRDSGVDIVAFPDPFGFEMPRIKVQVKHRRDQATAHEVRALAGTLRENENGLFVSTGGFTIDALNEPEKRANLSLVDREQFIKLLLENYDKLEPQYQALVPLRKVYIPVVPGYVSREKV